MTCVDKANYAVIINGLPSSFFPTSRGLRQGCPLSLLLFILAMDPLSLHINKVVQEDRCRPFHICKNVTISHNLFVDDIILFGIFCRITWLSFYEILKNFQRATGMLINCLKSIIYHNDIHQEDIDWLCSFFGIETHSINGGIKYLGYTLKANAYSSTDWQWIPE